MTKKKKILIVGPDLSLHGGVTHHVKTLLSSPLSHNYNIDYFKVGRSSNDSKFMILLRIILNPFRFLWRLWNFWPDVVHFNPSFDLKSLLRELNMLALCRLHRRSAIIQFHGGSLSQILQNNHLPIYLKLILKWASHIILLTNIQKAPVLKFCSCSKITVIPNMVDTTQYNQKKIRKDNRFNILYMSKIEFNKGVYDVIDAIQHVVEQEPNVRFIFAGDGPDKNKLEFLCRENEYDDFVKFIGYVKNQQKIDFLSKGDLFLFPSHYNEGMSYALLEAMAAGLAVIATPTGGTVEMIEDNVSGFLVPVEQPDKLAQAIIALLKNKKKRGKFGKLNRNKVVSEYDIEVVIQKFIKIYDQF